jgi:hypothetical protein
MFSMGLLLPPEPPANRGGAGLDVLPEFEDIVPSVIYRRPSFFYMEHESTSFFVC